MNIVCSVSSAKTGLGTFVSYETVLKFIVPAKPKLVSLLRLFQQKTLQNKAQSTPEEKATSICIRTSYSLNELYHST